MLETSLIVSYRARSDDFAARVKLARVQLKSQAVQHDGALKQVYFTVDEQESDTPSFDTTLGSDLTLQVKVHNLNSRPIPFQEGAERVLKALRPPERSKMVPENEYSLIEGESRNLFFGNYARLSRISSEPMITQEGGESMNSNHPDIGGLSSIDEDTIGYERPKSFGLSDLRQPDMNYGKNLLKENLKFTIYQLQYWILEGLKELREPIEYNTEKMILIKDLLKILVQYIEPMIFFLVRPVIEVAHFARAVRVARYCCTAFEYLEQFLQKEQHRSATSKLYKVLRTDWIDCFSIIYDRNQHLIAVFGSNSIISNSHERQKAAEMEYRFIKPKSSLARFLHSRNLSASLRSPPYTEEGRAEFRRGYMEMSTSTYSTKDFIVEAARYIQALTFREISAADNTNSPRKFKVELPVILWGSEFTLLVNDHFVVWVNNKHNTFCWARSDTIKSSFGPQGTWDEKTFKLSEIFHQVWLSEGYGDIWGSPFNPYWSWLQNGAVQIHTADQYYFYKDDYHEEERINNHRPLLQYVDLGQSHDGKASVAEIGLKDLLFTGKRIQIERYGFSAPSTMTKGSDEFLLGILEWGSYWNSGTGEYNLYLARFEIKQKQPRLKHTSVFSIWKEEFAMLDAQAEPDCSDYGGE